MNRAGAVTGLRAIFGGLLLWACAGAALAADPPAFAKWFRYDADVVPAWQIDEVPGQPLQVSVHHRREDSWSARPKVMVLYPRPSSAYDIAINKILHVFDAREIAAEITVVNFEIDDERGREALQQAKDGKFKLIFAMGSESTAWLYANYHNGAIPVVSVCSKDPVQLGQVADYDHGSGSNFAFTSLNMPIDVQMAYVRELQPDLRNIAVLVDAKNVSAVQTQAEPIAEYARRRGVQVIWGAVADPKLAASELAQIVRNAVQTMRKNDPELNKSLFWITGSTSVFRQIKVINDNADRVPVVSVVPEVVTAGADTAALAIGISFESNAHLAAIYGADILLGRAKVSDLKVGIVSPPDIAINFMKAREIGLRVPFSFFESASFVYDYDGKPVRTIASKVTAGN